MNGMMVPIRNWNDGVAALVDVLRVDAAAAVAATAIVSVIPPSANKRRRPGMVTLLDE